MTDTTKTHMTKAYMTKDMTMTVRTSRPLARELVRSDAVDALLETTDADLSTLRTRAVDLCATADELERQLADLGVSPESGDLLLVRLHEFLAGVRREALEEASAIVMTARRRLEIATIPVISWTAPRPAEPVAAPAPRLRFTFRETGEHTAGATVTAPRDDEVAGPAPEPGSEPEPAPVPEMVDLIALEADEATELAPVRSDDEFWTEPNRRPFWRRRPVTAAAALTALGVISAVLAVAVQVA